MNDIQILTLAVVVVVPFFGVMLGVLINNTRLNDVKEVLRAEIHAESAEMRQIIERHHSEVMAKLIDMDNRILRLESQRLIQ
jgi:hypothetical protein